MKHYRVKEIAKNDVVVLMTLECFFLNRVIRDKLFYP